MRYAVYIYRKFTPNIKRPSISYREVHRTKGEARRSAKRWRASVKVMNADLPKGWGAAYVRTRPIKTHRQMRKRSLMHATVVKRK